MAEVLDEARRLINDAAVTLARCFRHRIHQRPPLLLRRVLSAERRIERCGGVDLQGPEGNTCKAELRLDHFALNGHAQAAIDRARGLRFDREIGRSSTSSDASPSSMEKCQLDFF